MAGAQYDQETGLYYMRARYYDPELGRFLSEDPIGIAGGLNLYAYAGNDPVNASDPAGLDPCTTPDNLKGITAKDKDGHTFCTPYSPQPGDNWRDALAQDPSMWWSLYGYTPNAFDWQYFTDDSYGQVPQAPQPQPTPGGDCQVYVAQSHLLHAICAVQERSASKDPRISCTAKCLANAYAGRLAENGGKPLGFEGDVKNILVDHLACYTACQYDVASFIYHSLTGVKQIQVPQIPGAQPADATAVVFRH
jgi:RHS repeat-associated protein